jgi:YHS domain-containing protein
MKTFIATLSLILLMSVSSQAQTSTYYNPKGVALKGYDVVAYFTDGAAVKGDKKFSISWDSTTWHFRNQKNLDSFKADPKKYVPQFGGYCAYGASENHKAPTQPEAFTIVNGKLYLNYNKDVKELWLKDSAEHIRNAEENWPALKHQKF